MTGQPSYKISSSNLACEISGHGAGLTRFCLLEDSSELLGSWLSSQGTLTSGYVMCPNVGSISQDGRVNYKSKTFVPGKHGFARQNTFDLVEHSDSTLHLRSTHDPLLGPNLYPFRYHLDVKYKVANRHLRIEFAVENSDAEPMFFGGGLHPAFRWPRSGHDTASPHTLEIASGVPLGTKVHRPVNGQITKNHLSESKFNADGLWKLEHNDFIDDAYFFLFPDSGANISPAKLVFKTDLQTPSIECVLEGWEGFGIWGKPEENQEFICIEPLVGVSFSETDTPDISSVAGLRRLDPGQVFAAAMHITVL